MDEIRYCDAECNADDYDVVEIESGSGIAVWQTFVFFQTGITYTSTVVEVPRRHSVYRKTLTIDLLKRATSPDRKQDVKSC